jgi:VHL beta domain/PAN domain
MRKIALNILVLVLIVLSAGPTRAQSHDAPAQDTPSFQMFDNYVLSGDTRRNVPEVDLAACAAACRADNSCKAFSYDKWDRTCALKGEIGTFRLEPRTASGFPAVAAFPPMSDEPVRMACSPARLESDSESKSMSGASFSQCQSSCENDKDCVAFTYQSAQKSCLLLQSVSRMVPDTVAVSGVKRQDGPAHAIVNEPSCASFDHDAAALEQDSYAFARGNADKLAGYLKECSVCAFAKEAQQEIDSIKQQAERVAADKRAFEAARGDLQGLNNYLASCTECTYAEEAKKAVAAIEQQKRASEEQSRTNLRCSEEAQLHSINAETSTYVTFVNRSDHPIKTYWLNYQGVRTFYNQLMPGQSYRQQTFVTHPWVITDARLNCISILIPQANETTKVIR